MLSYIEDRIGGSGNFHRGDQSESIVITNKKDQRFSLNRSQFGGNVEVRHDDHYGSTVVITRFDRHQKHNLCSGHIDMR